MGKLTINGHFQSLFCHYQRVSPPKSAMFRLKGVGRCDQRLAVAEQRRRSRFVGHHGLHVSARRLGCWQMLAELESLDLMIFCAMKSHFMVLRCTKEDKYFMKLIHLDDSRCINFMKYWSFWYQFTSLSLIWGKLRNSGYSGWNSSIWLVKTLGFLWVSTRKKEKTTPCQWFQHKKLSTTHQPKDDTNQNAGLTQIF